jgi:glycine cleavage system aminomethyltransferase T
MYVKILVEDGHVYADCLVVCAENFLLENGDPDQMLQISCLQNTHTHTHEK